MMQDTLIRKQQLIIDTMKKLDETLAQLTRIEDTINSIWKILLEELNVKDMSTEQKHNKLLKSFDAQFSSMENYTMVREWLQKELEK